MFDPSKIDMRSITLAAAIKEGQRELALRENAYARWVDAERLEPEQAAKQFGGMLKLVQASSYLNKNGDDIKLGLELVKMFRDKPEGLLHLSSDPLLRAALQQFPDAQITALREIAKAAKRGRNAEAEAA